MKKQEIKAIKALAEEIAKYGRLPKQLAYEVKLGAEIIKQHIENAEVTNTEVGAKIYDLNTDSYYRTGVKIRAVGVEKTLKKMKTWQERYAYAASRFESGSERSLHYLALSEGNVTEAQQIKEMSICTSAPIYDNVGTECTTTL